MPLNALGGYAAWGYVLSRVCVMVFLSSYCCLSNGIAQEKVLYISCTQISLEYGHIIGFVIYSYTASTSIIYMLLIE